MKKGSHHTEESKRKMRESALGKVTWNKGLTKETDERIKRQYVKPFTEKHKIKISNALRGRKPSQKCIDASRKARLGKKPPNYGKLASEATKQKLHDANIGKTGKQSSAWKGGISFEPYCSKFDNSLKERVREFFDRRCYVCDKTEEENGERLSVHHVNYNKMICCNDVKPLFVPLCRRHNAIANFNRESWEEFFTVSLEYLTNGECFLPKGV